MVRLRNLNRRRPEDEGNENVLVNKPDQSMIKKRRPRFRRNRQKNKAGDENNIRSTESTVTSTSDGPVAPMQPGIIPHFSKFADMAILHNAVSTSAAVNGEVDSPDSTTQPSSVFRTGTRNAMRFALQSRMYEEKNINNFVEKWEHLGDDPTVEESIECVFEHQLEEGLDLTVEEDDIDSVNDFSTHSDDYSSQKMYTSGKLTHVASYSPFLKRAKDTYAWLDHSFNTKFPNSLTPGPIHKANRSSDDHSVSRNLNALTAKKLEFFSCNVCKDGSKPFIGINPQDWPQAPLFLRSSPGSGTKVIGVRYADSNDYLMNGTLEKQWWNEIPNRINDKQRECFTNSTKTCCQQCWCLPINNGNEPMGKTLVIDFESECFQGTLQVRIRHSNGTTVERYDDSQGYFHGFNRQYQSIVQGRFKKEGIPMIRCKAGQTFKDALKLPPTYIVKAGLKVIQFFAPRLSAKVDGNNPFVVSPLGSTPQTITVDLWKEEDGSKFRPEGLSNSNNVDCFEQKANKLVEPIEESRRLIPYKCSNSTSSVARAKARKKAFDQLCADGDESHTFRTDKIYTFESLQHLVDFRPFEVNLGSILGKMDLSPIFNGQPMNIMAGYQLPNSQSSGRKGTVAIDKFWSFEIWHERMVDRMHQKNI